MSHLALLKHETQAIKNPPPTFQTVSLSTTVNKSIREEATVLDVKGKGSEEASKECGV
jgi:hypothetical protein